MYKLYICFLFIVPFNINSQELVQMSMGSSYQYDIFYSIENGITAFPERTNWELAFSTDMYDNNIRINSGAAMQLFEVSQDINDWENVSSLGSNFIELKNSNTNWSTGAFKSNNSGGLDYGWGNYNASTNTVEGSKIYVLYYSEYEKKIKIDNLTMGVYTFTVANLDGSQEQIISIDASLYNNKKFIYYSLQNNLIIDREPNSDNWDILFTKYKEEYVTLNSDTMPYIVTGALTNNNLIAEYNGFLDVNPFFFDLNPTRDINTIGYDWKEYTGSYSMVANRSYFISDQQEESIYKIIFDSFEGGSSGNLSFIIENSENISLDDNDVTNLSIFPNPNNGLFNIYVDGKDMYNIVVSNSSGQIVLNDSFISATKLDIRGLSAGIYSIHIASNTNSYIKLISVE